MGALIGLYFKSANPEGRDITQGLAYLGYILIPTFITMIIGWLGALFMLIKARKIEHDDVTRLALVVFSLMTFLVATIALVNKAEDSVVNNYRVEQSR